jgi:sigma-E factor negative regulatory protein RseB
MKIKHFRSIAFMAWALVAINYVAAQAPPSAASIPVAGPGAGVPAESRSINDWLMRMHEAGNNRTYTGTIVVSSGGVMSSAKIWRVCKGDHQVERVETLTGLPRSIFRHNDKVATFMPELKVVRREQRDSLGRFPDLLQSTDTNIADFYKLRQDGVDRVAGVQADVIVLSPKDMLRFGYRVWIEQKTGLVVKLQTLDTAGKVLEQAAFSELQLDAPVNMDKLIQMMGKVKGYRVEEPVLVKTTGGDEGWVLKEPVAGFAPAICYRRPVNPAANQANTAVGEAPLQWIFSDGLASVSIFIEPFDQQRHGRESSLSLGATQTMTKRADAYWITLMGEVPMATLQLFANRLERQKQ